MKGEKDTEPITNVRERERERERESGGGYLLTARERERFLAWDAKSKGHIETENEGGGVARGASRNERARVPASSDPEARV